MPNTPNYSLPYPLATEPADVPADLQELANATDAALTGFDVRVDATEAFDPRLDALEAAAVSLDGRLDTLEPTIPTARIVPGANGEVLMTVAGTPAWGTGGGGGGAMQVIQDKQLVADGALDFTAIPGTFRHLRLIASLRSAQSTVAGLACRFNGDAGGHPDSPPTVNQTSHPLMGFLVGTDRPAGVHAFLVMDIADYAATTHHKSATWRAGWFDGTSTISSDLVGHWKSLAVINRVHLLPAAGAFATGSRATLYGIG